MKYAEVDCRNYFIAEDFVNSTYEEKGMWIEALLFCCCNDLDGVILDYRLPLNTDVFSRMKEHGESNLWTFVGSTAIIIHYFNHDAFQKYLSKHFRLNGHHEIILSYYNHIKRLKSNNNRVTPSVVGKKKDKRFVTTSTKKGVAYAVRLARKKSG